MSERTDIRIWAQAKALHKTSGDVRAWAPEYQKREEGSSTPAHLSDDERNRLYDAVASQQAGKEDV